MATVLYCERARVWVFVLRERERESIWRHVARELDCVNSELSVLIRCVCVYLCAARGHECVLRNIIQYIMENYIKVLYYIFSYIIIFYYYHPQPGKEMSQDQRPPLRRGTAGSHSILQGVHSFLYALVHSSEGRTSPSTPCTDNYLREWRRD